VHHGEFFGIEATGEKVNIEGFSIGKFNGEGRSPKSGSNGTGTVCGNHSAR